MEAFFTLDPLLNGSKGLIYIGEKVLVYRRDTNTNYYPLFLDLPGGGADAGETPFETFKREVSEEFSLSIEPSDISYVRRYESVRFAGEYVYFPVARLSAEHEKVIVFGGEGLSFMLLNPDEFLRAPDVCPGLLEKTQDYLNTIPIATP